MKNILLTTLICFVIGLYSVSATANNRPLSIGVMLWRGETPFDQAFIAEIKKQRPDSMFYVVNSEQKLRRTVSTLRSIWRASLMDMDYILCFGSRNCLKIREELKNTAFKGVLIAFGNTSILLDAHLNRQTNQEKLLLGRPSVLDSSVLEIFLPMLQAKKIAVPFNLFEPQSREIIPAMQQVAREYGADIFPIRIRPEPETISNQIGAALRRHKEYDLLFFPLDSFLISQAEKLGKLTRKANILSIGSFNKYVEHGIGLGLSPNYANIGKRLAKQVIDIETGTPLYRLPVVYSEDNLLIANRKSLQETAPQLLDSLPRQTKFIE
ncbi:hypothetical protein [Terasakiella sp. SH-1]|uniref:hypothetical protein n=1 Tax=Terasakiella sp. SH-1 TaxID=2560057 RepID=UPI00107486F2|nr:hypothetical protein [Terasakiella sp. SH-1]